MLSFLWDGAYKRCLADNQKEIPSSGAVGFLYLSGPLPYVQHHLTVNKMCGVC